MIYIVYFIVDIESFVREKLAERTEDDTITISHSRFEAILQKLAHKEMKLQNAYDRIDRMKYGFKTINFYMLNLKYYLFC